MRTSSLHEITGGCDFSLADITIDTVHTSRDTSRQVFSQYELLC